MESGTVRPAATRKETLWRLRCMYIPCLLLKAILWFFSVVVIVADDVIVVVLGAVGGNAATRIYSDRAVNQAEAILPRCCCHGDVFSLFPHSGSGKGTQVSQAYRGPCASFPL